MKPVRSLLYVPANKPEWVARAPETYDADAVIYDLEDAVPSDLKPAARDVLADALSERTATETVITARVNAPGTGEFDADLDAVVRPGLDAVVIPKLARITDVERAHHVLDHLESTRDLDAILDLVLLPETARSINRAERLCSASDRVAALIAGSSPGGDIERALGFEWTREGHERRHMLSKLVMDGRAAGLGQLVAGPWLDIEDLDGLRTEAEMARQLGYTGFQVVHPSHVGVVNEVFIPDVAEAERARDLIAAFEESDAVGVFTFEGEMIDTAHRVRAEQLLERARAFDVLE